MSSRVVTGHSFVVLPVVHQLDLKESCEGAKTWMRKVSQTNVVARQRRNRTFVAMARLNGYRAWLPGCLRKSLPDWSGATDAEHSFNDPSVVLASVVVGKRSGADGALDLGGTAVCVFVGAALSAAIGKLALVRLHRSSLSPLLLYRHRGRHP